MTSELDGSKTNEILRRRKLRLQQVREQSKDIAKKIRQRAKVENLRQVIELDSKKKKEYLERQEQLVKKLEEYYAAGLKNVGSSHRNASDVLSQGADGDKIDLSKQRGREAAAELRKRRQQILDKQKELLDRRLQARELANEISRDKTGTTLNKLLPRCVSTGIVELQSKSSIANFDSKTKKDSDVAKTDMATQWDLDEMPNEWEPDIPTLLLPKDDNSVKESNNNIVDSKSEKSKRVDLFAVSEEMPSSLLGGSTTQEERVPAKSSLTLVSEYLQNRDLRLREPDTTRSNKKNEDFQSLKQTILHTRTSREAKGDTMDRQLKSNKIKSTEDSAVPKKNVVTTYNHTTRDSRDIPFKDERLVVRNLQDADDAYSQAMKESSTSQSEDKDHQKKVQEIRSKIAMTKQSVEKEYRDTMSFLSALPKDKGSKPIKTAYMDEQRQQMQKDIRQQKLQQEYRKIEKECGKRSCKKKIRSKSRSPIKVNSNDVFEREDIQYSWMPVPEGDGNLAIHTIPTTVREGKSNSVKFSKVDSYHEYRSRHKHTPPTKETADKPKHETPNRFEMHDSSDSDSTSSASSIQSVRLVKKDKTTDNKEVSDAERIIIYKILDSKSGEQKKTSKLMKNIAKSLTRIEQKTRTDDEQSKGDAKKLNSNEDAENIVSFEQLDEGVYKTVNENRDNIASMYFHDKDAQPTNGKNMKRRCSGCKNRTKQPRKVSAPHQWDSSDEFKERPHSPRSAEYQCTCKTNRLKDLDSPVRQPSATTSTTSFITAANDKASNATSEGGFIKLVDEDGRETGKFYIGASGLLKNDAYEVVIQLRKKGDEKDSPKAKSDKKKYETQGVDKMTVVSSTQTSLKDIYEGSENKMQEDAAIPTSVVTEPPENNIPVTERDSYQSEGVSDRGSRQTLMGNAADNVTSNEPIQSKAVEKAISAIIEEPNPQKLPESQAAPVPRPATSTYTQTSMNSPIHRPTLFHMSSSTSTAYMSPPEMIVPKFMRPGYQVTDKDMYDPRNFAVGEIVPELHEYSEEADCNCRECKHAKRLTQTNRIPPSHKCKYGRNQETPPNTAGSIRSGVLDNVYYNEDLDSIGAYGHVHSKRGSKRTSRKCTKHSLKHEHLESVSQKKSRNSMPTKILSRNQVIRAPSSTPSKKGQLSSRRNKPNLKPVIKNYVDKLLQLNKESLKAVQIVDQDCSTVATPGSSVINIPNNINKNKPNLENKLSLEKLRDILKQKIVDENETKSSKTDGNNRYAQMCYRVQSSRNTKNSKLLRKKPAHKVKSLNISKKMSRSHTSGDSHAIDNTACSLSSTKDECRKKRESLPPSRNKVRSKSSPTPRLPPNSDTTDRSELSDLPHTKFDIAKFSKRKPKPLSLTKHKKETHQTSGSSNHAMTTTSNDSDRHPNSSKHNNTEIPMSISTQTSINVDSDVNYMKLAEDKLQNMEKIADLTEKCTKRLSNLAKVLEEVRKNKTLAYSHISTTDSTSDSDQKTDKLNINSIPLPPENNEIKTSELNSPDVTKTDSSKEDNNSLNSTGYIPFLSNIPKPVPFKSLNSDLGVNSSSSSSRKSDSTSPIPENVDQSIRQRAKPPPALSRVHLKYGQELVIPHELSTVVEVDSPMSIKLKSSRNDTKTNTPETPSSHSKRVRQDHCHSPLTELKIGDANDPDLLDGNEVSIEQQKTTLNGTDNVESDKVQMIDIEQFNEIMLKPFFSLQEYAKQCNIGTLDDGSNLDDVLKGDPIDELSSLHSEASLPDVISELLKRNIISEPFKFDSGSNVNSTTISSESTISILALSRARYGTKKYNKAKNKENIGETSDTLSISSNPDLENAFKKLGMGWASSTLKKTKERLALSSSSNSSSSSLSQFKVKGFNQDAQEPVTDTISSLLSLPNAVNQRNGTDNSKNAEQQTSKTNAMTVKEFLTNELAKKITFNNKSKDETTEEFVSLYETKMPEEMKHSSLMVREENKTVDNSMFSGNNVRARTSTPVQLYKTMTYQSSSSSNMSNGLFSNADDLSSVKVTSNSMKHSTSDKDDLIIPNYSLRMKKSSDYSKSD